MKKQLLFVALLLSFISGAQEIVKSNTYVRTCLNDVECSSINSSSYLFYDEAKARFYLKIDFNEMKTGMDSVDFWLEDLNDTYLYFKASLTREQFPNASSSNAKNVRLNGQMFLNNVWRPQVIDISIYKTEGEIMSNTVNANKLDAYKVNFSFSFLPKDFNIHKKPNRLTNNIFIGVGGGFINSLKPGMESQMGEAYERE
jgi:hypothetical protein